MSPFVVVSQVSFGPNPMGKKNLTSRPSLDLNVQINLENAKEYSL